MSTVGQKEKQTQQRVVKLLREKLGYRYLGNWEELPNNRNIEPELLRAWLKQQGHSETLIGRVLYELDKAEGDTSKSLYDRNRTVYDLLRYGLKVKLEAGQNHVNVWLVDWQNPGINDFAVAEEVTVAAAHDTAHSKRLDIVLYVNGIALAVIELKRSTVCVAEGIRQNLDNQKKEFIQPFFSTIQLLMAGNDTEGLRYGSIETKEKYYLSWKAPSKVENPLDRAVHQLCDKATLLELVHDFILFDAGIKKLCRHNQYFAVRASQAFVERREGGIIWNTQGSGKSHYFWGRRYRLRVVTTPGAQQEVVHRKNTLQLVVRPETDSAQRERVLQRWYRQQLRALIPPLIDKWQASLGVQAADWGIKKMKTKWGARNIEARRIWLNLELAKKPVPCLEYIVAHELVHLLERNHNDRFMALMDKLVPLWRSYRQELNSTALANETWSY
jgi:predicted metal-dependent hydrolase